MHARSGAWRCWPATTRSRSWQVQANGGSGHAADTWRKWMEPVRPRSLPQGRFSSDTEPARDD